jgi:hypothetical protein
MHRYLDKVAKRMRVQGSILRRTSVKATMLRTRTIGGVPSATAAPLVAFDLQKLNKNALHSVRRFSTDDRTSKVVNSAKEALSDCIFPGISINCGGFGLGGYQKRY